MDANAKMVPALAESWEQPDNVTYAFHLRKGVKFHDGTSFNASAVVFMDWYNRNGPGSNNRAIYVDVVNSVQAVDDYTVKYVLNRPYAMFLLDIQNNVNNGLIVSPSAVKKWGEEFGRHPVGTGSFKFVEWVTGSTITLAANEGYWQGRPALDKLVFKYVPDDAVRVLEMKSGRVDIAEIPLKFATEIKNTPGLKVYVGPAEAQNAVSWINTKVQPGYKSFFTDKRVRQAVNYALDKKAFIDTIVDGWGVPSVGLVRYGYPGYAPYLAKYNYDPAKAKQLLADAGYPNGFEVNMIARSLAYHPFDEPDAIMVKSQLAKVGITVNLEILDRNTFWDRVWKSQLDLASGGWMGGPGDSAHSILYRVHSRLAGPGLSQWNWENIRDPRLDSLVDQLLDTPLEQESKWKPLSDEIQRILIDEAYECPLFDYNLVHASTMKVQGYGLVTPIRGIPIWSPNIGVKVWLNQTGSKAPASLIMPLSPPAQDILTISFFAAVQPRTDGLPVTESMSAINRW
jgi:peptide/nickel transport system substrate-binding protein